jgi:hypothetical protein
MRLLPFGRRKLRTLKPERYTGKWQALQGHCASRKTWPQAIAEADDLLAEALKRRGYKGKNTGERLVAAQHDLSDNEAVWLGHKLRNKVSQEDVDVRKIKKKDMLEALSGFRQALRDLGALRS